VEAWGIAQSTAKTGIANMDEGLGWDELLFVHGGVEKKKIIAKKRYSSLG